MYPVIEQTKQNAIELLKTLSSPKGFLASDLNKNIDICYNA